MATFNGPIKPKRSTVSGEVPQPEDLDYFELASNTADGKLFIKHTDDTIKEISGGGASAPVDSVNGQIGAVSLGIQDMDDYGQNVNLDYKTWQGDDGSFDDGTTWLRDLSDSLGQYIIYIASNDTNGNSYRDELEATPASGSIYFRIAGQPNWTVFPYSVRYVNENNNVRFVNDGTINPSLFPADTTDLVEIALSLDNVQSGVSDGDVLAWNEATQKFFPVTPASGSIAWQINANGSSSYDFTGPGFPSSAANPALTLVRGQTYVFNNVSGAHPFQIQSTSGLGGTPYSDGVTGNATVGAVTFVVPMDAPAELYYQCTAHAGMNGTIAVLENGTGSGDDGAQFPPSVVGWTIDSSSAPATSQTLDAPSHSAGDLFVACISSRDSLTPPSGWSLEGSYLGDIEFSGSFQKIYVFTKIATDSEPVEYTWTVASSVRVCGFIAAVRNAVSIDSVRQSYGNSSTASIITVANVLNITAATWVYSATSETESYSQTGPGVTEITDSPEALARISGGYTTVEGTVISTHNSNTTDNSPNHGIIAISLSPSSYLSIDRNDDVDTSTVPPTDGQALVWDDTSGQWKPGTVSGSGGGGGVDSVNGQTGDVELGITQLDDVTATGDSLKLDSVRQIHLDDSSLSNTSAQLSANSDINGLLVGAYPTTSSNYDEVSAAYFGEHLSFRRGNSAGDAAFNFQNGWNGAVNGHSGKTNIRLWTGADPFTPTGGGYVGFGSPSVVSQSYVLRLPGSAGQAGQVLQTSGASSELSWVDLPSGGSGGAVDSVNGQTGDVEIGVEQLDDFALKPSPANRTPVYLYQSYRESGDCSVMEFAVLHYQSTTSLGKKPLLVASGSQVVLDFAGWTGFEYSLVGENGPWTEVTGLPITINQYGCGSASLDYDIYAETGGIGTTPDIWVRGLVQNQQDIPLSNGDILVYNEADQQWNPQQPSGGGGAVDSVNGQTGVVELGIFDLSDVQSLNSSPPRWDLVPIADTSSGMPPGQAFQSGTNLSVSPIDNLGRDVTALLRAWVAANPATNSSPYELTWIAGGVASTEDMSGWTDQLEESGPYFPRLRMGWATTVGAQVSGEVELPQLDAFAAIFYGIEDGDVLQWDSTDQQFKPAQLPSGGGVEEAPEDGTPYVRQDAGWVSAPTGVESIFELSDVQLAIDTTIYQLTGEGNGSPPNGPGGWYVGPSSNKYFTWYKDDPVGGYLFSVAVGDDVTLRCGGVTYTAACSQTARANGNNAWYMRLDNSDGGFPSVFYTEADNNGLMEVILPSDVTIPVAEGDFLQWNGVAFEPAQLPAAGGAVDSVQDKTGDVRLTIQEMDDYLSPATVYTWSVRSNNYNTTEDNWNFASQNGGTWYRVNTTGANSEFKTLLAASVSGDIVWVSLDGSDFTPLVISVYPVEINEEWVQFWSGSNWPNGVSYSSPLKIAFSDPGLVSPLADGDILQWDNAEQKFKPAQLPSGGGGGGGEGASSLGELSDVELTSTGQGDLLRYDGTAYKNAPISEVLRGQVGGEIPLSSGPVLMLGDINNRPTNTELTNLGFTASSGADDDSFQFIPDEKWKSVKFLGLDYSGSLNYWYVNSNGAVYAHSTPLDIDARTANFVDNAGQSLFYVSVLSQDTKVSTWGWKEEIFEGKEYLIVRGWFYVPYNSSSGFSFEVWFGIDGTVKVSYGNFDGDSTLFVKNDDRCGIASEASKVTAWGSLLDANGAAQTISLSSTSSDIPGALLSDISDVNVDGVADGQGLKWDEASSQWIATDLGGGGGATRYELVATTASLADQAAEALTLADAGTFGTFLSIETDAQALVTFYTSQTELTADASRDGTATSPTSGDGVLLEILTNPAEPLLITPSVQYFTIDADSILTAKIKNLSGADTSVSLTVKGIKLEG